MSVPWTYISLVLFAAFVVAAAAVKDMPASGVLGGAAVLSLLLMERD